MSEHINDEPEWTDFKIRNLEVTNEHHDQEIQPIEEDNEFPNNNDDDYASPTRDSTSHSQTPHTSSTCYSQVNSQVTPNISTQSNYQSGNDSIQTINSPSHFDHTPLRGFKTLNDLYENTEELLLAENEPKNYKESSSDKKWIEAMKVELDSINRNNTWELTTLPKGHKAIGLKWVFKTKKDANGNIIKHKARLVAKGYIQEHGMDFEEVFALVARMETIRLLLPIAASNKWKVHHLDVKSAFLHGDLKEEVYVTQPEGFIKKHDNGKVYRLIKALYELRQAPRAWNIKLDNTLKSLDFKKYALEQAIYTKTSKDSTLLIGVYQTAYANKILKEARMLDCNETLIPMDPGTRLTKFTEGTMVNSTEYQSLIGCLRYLLHTRPDLSYSVGLLSRVMQEPREQHMKAIRQVLRYIKGTKDCGITYKHNGRNKIYGFSDSSYGVNTQEGKGTTGIIFYYGESPISWSTQKQATIALSSCESEFIAATQALWLKRLRSKLTHSEEEKVTIKVDNKSAIALIRIPYFIEESIRCSNPDNGVGLRCPVLLHRNSALPNAISTADTFDEYLQMSEHTARDALFSFNMCIMELYMPKYLRKPTSKDVVNIQQKHNNVHGFSRMLGSIDCMHWEWKNCLVSWQAGANNDINVLDNSPLFDDLLDNLAHVVPYVVNGIEYRNGYYLADEIYPEWASFVKSFTVALIRSIRTLNSVKKVYEKMSNVLSVFSKDILDSGVTHYMSYLLSQFISLNLNSWKSIGAANGNSMPLEGIGSIDTPSIALFDVYYILSLTMNLASVSKICDSGCDVKFSDSDCSIYDPKTHECGFVSSNHDSALFVKRSSVGRILLSLYVDDMIITGDDCDEIELLKAELSHRFAMKDLGLLRYFLSIEVASSPKGYLLSQSKYIVDLLDRERITDKMVEDIPIDGKAKYTPTDDLRAYYDADWADDYVLASLQLVRAAYGFTTTMLAWSLIEFSVYIDFDHSNAISALRWSTDYLFKATTTTPGVLYVQ
nr:ribonuclease H-like domain, reverse transcriptase, RNA-dependent DNA polymerase [Tanacetum cinerariifolium]